MTRLMNATLAGIAGHSHIHVFGSVAMADAKALRWLNDVEPWPSFVQVWFRSKLLMCLL
jgi:hypothetical protein